MIPRRLSVPFAVALVLAAAPSAPGAQEGPPVATPDGRAPTLESVPTTTAAALDPDRVETLVGRPVASAEGREMGVVASVARDADGRAATLGVTFEGNPLVAVPADRAVVEAESGRLRLVDLPADRLAGLPPFR